MLSRRSILGALPAAVVARHGHATSSRPRINGFDLSKPEDNVKLYAKVVGSLDERTIYLQYYGEIFSVVPNQVQNRILRLKGIAKSKWEQTGEHTYFRRNYDFGLFCDPESEEILETYQNPFTGKQNTPLHYKSGPLEGTISPLRSNGQTYILPWRVTGDQLSLTQTAYGERENYLSPDTWPKASTGRQLYFNTSSTYFADVEDVENPELVSVTADHVWTFLTPFPAWMLVADMPGFAMWRWAARKIVDVGELDVAIVAGIEQRVPNFFADEQPWKDHSNGWIQYTKERKPQAG